jgi:Photosynthetic reaction centre cytochrome C subunit
VKPSSLFSFFAAAALLAASAFTPAQAPQDQPPASQGGPPAAGQAGRPMRNFPVPTNLKVLPKSTSPEDLHKIMETWAGSLGVHCDTCHIADPKNIGPNGRPRLKFADDSKTDKQIARIMYTMVQQINADYIKKTMDMDKDQMEDAGSPVTCGTCHQGHKHPPEFVVPPEAQPGGPGGPPAGSGAPPTAAPPSN